MSRLVVSVIVSAGLLGIATAVSAAPIQGAQDGWAAITACSGMSNDEARRDCMDGVLRRAGLLSGEARPPQPASAGRPNVLGLSLPARHDDAPREVTLEKARIDGEGRLELVATDGETWRSQETGLQLPRSGQAMSIEPAGLSTFECRVSKWESFLCRQDRPR